MGDHRAMIRKGSIVRRKSNNSNPCSMIRYDVLRDLYPPESEICIVTSNPKEVDLSTHDKHYTGKTNLIVLKKGIEVVYNGKWYGPCDVNAFEEVKKNGQ